MPLSPKVKSRITTLLLTLMVLVCVRLVVAIEANDVPCIGVLAVTPPRPPSFAPPLLDRAKPRNSQLKIDLIAQRLYFLVDDEVAIDSPISSGRKDFDTPTGQFFVGKKELKRKPGDYGNFTTLKGKIVVSGAYLSRDPIPSGLRFQAVALHHVLEIKGQTFSIHGGATCSLPISTGDIIVPDEIAKRLFAKVSTACPVEIVSE